MEAKQFKELLLQSLEHERGGETLYPAAIECAQNEDLRKEWTKYLEETRNHARLLEGVARAMGIDPELQTPGRSIVAKMAQAMRSLLEDARKAGDPQAAQIVAAEVITLAETKDHLDWELLGECVPQLQGAPMQTLKDAYDEAEDQEDEHLYHTKGWCRELWLDSLGLKAELPPPEERKHVKTAIDAARAEQSRKH